MHLLYLFTIFSVSTVLSQQTLYIGGKNAQDTASCGSSATAPCATLTYLLQNSLPSQRSEDFQIYFVASENSDYDYKSHLITSADFSGIKLAAQDETKVTKPTVYIPSDFTSTDGVIVIKDHPSEVKSLNFGIEGISHEPETHPFLFTVTSTSFTASSVKIMHSASNKPGKVSLGFFLAIDSTLTISSLSASAMTVSHDLISAQQNSQVSLSDVSFINVACQTSNGRVVTSTGSSVAVNNSQILGCSVSVPDGSQIYVYQSNFTFTTSTISSEAPSSSSSAFTPLPSNHTTNSNDNTDDASSWTLSAVHLIDSNSTLTFSSFIHFPSGCVKVEGGHCDVDSCIFDGNAGYIESDPSFERNLQCLNNATITINSAANKNNQQNNISPYFDLSRCEHSTTSLPRSNAQANSITLSEPTYTFSNDRKMVNVVATGTGFDQTGFGYELSYISSTNPTAEHTVAERKRITPDSDTKATFSVWYQLWDERPTGTSVQLRVFYGDTANNEQRQYSDYIDFPVTGGVHYETPGSPYMEYNGGGDTMGILFIIFSAVGGTVIIALAASFCDCEGGGGGGRGHRSYRSHHRSFRSHHSHSHHSHRSHR